MYNQGREWISSNADNTGPWDTQVNIPLGPSGYPLEIPFRNGVNPPQKVKTLLVWDLFEATPKGKYRLIVKGSGEVQLNFGARGSCSPARAHPLTFRRFPMGCFG